MRPGDKSFKRLTFAILESENTSVNTERIQQLTSAVDINAQQLDIDSAVILPYNYWMRSRLPYLRAKFEWSFPSPEVGFLSPVVAPLGALSR